MIAILPGSWGDCFINVGAGLDCSLFLCRYGQELLAHLKHKWFIYQYYQ